MEHQRLLDRLNIATENLRQALRDKTRAEDQEAYWNKQISILNAQLKREWTD